MAEPHQVLFQIITSNNFKDAERLIRSMRRGKSKELEALLHVSLAALEARGVSFDRDIPAIIDSIVGLCPDPTPLDGSSEKTD